VYSGIGIAVGNEYLPLVVQGDAGGHVEGRAAVGDRLEGGGAVIVGVNAGVGAHALLPDSHNVLSVAGVFVDFMSVAVHQPDVVVVVQQDGVGEGNQPRAPG